MSFGFDSAEEISSIISWYSGSNFSSESIEIHKGRHFSLKDHSSWKGLNVAFDCNNIYSPTTSGLWDTVLFTFFSPYICLY